MSSFKIKLYITLKLGDNLILFVSVSLVQREIELDPDNDEYPAIQIKVSRLVDA